jgi:hypothetical protein
MRGKNMDFIGKNEKKILGMMMEFSFMFDDAIFLDTGGVSSAILPEICVIKYGDKIECEYCGC